MGKTTVQQEDVNKDLGLGSRVANQSHQRFLNRDGSFNVRRSGHSFFRSLNIYHWMLTISWIKFNFIVVVAYFLTNVIFATGYLLCGHEAMRGAVGATTLDRFLEAFFFSVQTLATIGYGGISPNGLAANILVTFEALFGLLGFAIATGLLFARFSRPSAKIMFSDNALIAPYKNGTSLQFRIVNERSNQLIGTEATVVLSRLETAEGKPFRKFYPLTLERTAVMFMPLHWTIVHPIDEASPLFNVTKETFDATDPEILILLTAVDETFSQTVHARSSYKFHEVVWNAKFADIFEPSDDGNLSIDLRKLHAIENL